jgi:hypothetical protein
MELVDELTKLIQDGMLHWSDHRDKAAAIKFAVSRLEQIGFTDSLESKLSAAIDRLKVLEGEDGEDLTLIMERILRQTLFERVGYEPTETDIGFPTSKTGIDDLEAPEPVR